MEKNEAIAVGGANFSWDSENGTFLFEEQDAILFWINSAFKTFLDTIEEVSGDEAAALVLETTGYRMGTIVGDYFHKSGTNVKEVLQVLTGVYASAGWGKLEIPQVNLEAETAVLQMRNSWEYKINKLQNKTESGTFIPGHWAGVLSGLFGRNIWYKIRKSQIKGDPYCEFEFYPSEVTITQNVHDLARRLEQGEIARLENVVAERTRELTSMIKEISSPIIPVLEHIVVVPLVGKYDETRSNELLEKTVNQLPRYKAKFLILDLTGLTDGMNDYALSLLEQLVSATRLLGTKTIMVGVSPDLSMNMAQTDSVLKRTKFFANLKHGIHYALEQEGMGIVKLDTE
ncbi:STAS domain-containing protein [Bacillus lacus]|uniref:STAS domain-containing protein n=1 Tax=Metabacillus lacus TaxID=1983721 RepID=A0A7X2LY76_9BACI|nr:STAS domain-containing protein [Metabacillus lacus]MRX72066.1 STAS domain-containing protein [Metabacillus lacus]